MAKKAEGFTQGETEWSIISKYFADNQAFISKHHIDSFDHFVQKRLVKTIREINPIAVVRNDDAGRTRHVINVYVGCKDGSHVTIARPVLAEHGTTRPLYPNDARVRGFYYCADVLADVDIEYVSARAGGGAPVLKRFEGVRIGCIPIMVNSSLCALHKQPPEVRREMGDCPYDQGGYFIVDGKEKVIVCQERIVTNRLFVTAPQDDKKHRLEAQIQCTAQDDPFKKTVMLYVSAKTNGLLVKVPDIVDQEIPLFVVFRALGVESDRQIIGYVLGTDVLSGAGGGSAAAARLLDFLYYSVVDNMGIYTQEAAYEHLKQHVRYQSTEHVKHILVNDLLRNTGADMHRKRLFLGGLARRMIETLLGVVPMADRDSYIHKRVDTSGALVSQLFRDFYNVFRKQVRGFVESAYNAGPWATDPSHDISRLVREADLTACFDARIIESGIKVSLKGNWANENDPDKEGIVQDLNRISYAGYLSHCRRLNTPLDRGLKLVQPRRLDTSQWGLCCPIQSPDGASIGLDKHMSVLTYVSVEADHAQMAECLRDLGCVTTDAMNAADAYARVMLDNDLFGAHDDPARLVREFRALRRDGAVNACCSIAWSYKLGEVHVSCEEGRLMRPLLVVDPATGRLAYDRARHGALRWHQLFHGANAGREFEDPGYDKRFAGGRGGGAPLELLDLEEANGCLVAMYPHQLGDGKPYTHCEIHPSTVLSLYTNTIPFAHHNQAPRNIFSGQQGKAAIGVYATNFNNRMDVMSYVLHYPQKPLVSTKYGRYTGNERLPNGENLMVAIACYGGYNQEDAVLINRAAVERGCFNVLYTKTIGAEEEDNSLRGTRSFFCNPYDLQRKGLGVQPRRANELTLDEHGMPKLNAQVEEGDAVLGRVGIATEQAGAGGKKVVQFRDQTLVADKTVEGVVDRALVYKDEKGDRVAKVRLRKVRLPVLGDKVASRHGQKGVVGMVVDACDMPFTRDGLVPDIIINPHAIPSRMTVGHMIECVAAKLAALEGCVIDGTVFIQHDVDAYCEGLAGHGYERHGNELLYDGKTGAQIESDIFFGPTYYLRLKHMVADKVNYRATGPVSATTRQPMRGRAGDGGLRLGEMEKEAMLAHGATMFLKEAFVDKSDGYAWRDDDGAATGADRPHTRVTPYSFKLLKQEVLAMGVKMTLTEPGHVFEDGSE